MKVGLGGDCWDRLGARLEIEARLAFLWNLRCKAKTSMDLILPIVIFDWNDLFFYGFCCDICGRKLGNSCGRSCRPGVKV